ncbi:MAG: recombination protein O N-terminal domain-containing protein [Treponema sp.]|nr:recombination protein O N-terminal domain-containing protein [Candidatus Treponema merdequi]
MRNNQKEALILTVKPQGESNRLITYITKEDGICTSLLYGGPKSKLRSLVSPWNFGQIYLYNDESKNSSKITDFDVKKYHPSFRENLYKTMAANVATEIVITTKCGGSSQECFTLLNGFLDGLDLLSEEHSKSGLIRFLWRYLGLLGIQPQNFTCLKCDKAFFSGNLSQNAIEYKSGGAFYSQSENGFICEDCFKLMYDSSEKQFISKITSKAVVYLEATALLEPSVSRNMTLTINEIEQLKDFVFSLITLGVGKIKSLQSGIGIL